MGGMRIHADSLGDRTAQMVADLVIVAPGPATVQP
jgi:hypothetical protein